MIQMEDKMGYVIMFIIGLVLQIGAIAGFMATFRAVEHHTRTEVQIIDNETGEVCVTRHSPFDHKRFKIERR